MKLRLLFVVFLFPYLVLAQSQAINYSLSPNDTICPSDTVHFLQHFNASYNYGFGFGPNEPGDIWLWGTDSTNGTNTGGINFFMHFDTPGPYTFTLSAMNGPHDIDSVMTIWVLPDTAGVTLTAGLSQPICTGQPLSFTATALNGGSSPVFQWSVNGTVAGNNSPFFNAGVLNNGDVVSVSMQSNARCVTQPVVATYTVEFVTPVTPSVTISPDPVVTCASGFITFTATPANGGASPSFVWSLNGINGGTSSNTYTLNNPVGGSEISVTLVSNATCITTDTAFSDTVVVSVTPFSIPAGNLQNICSGDSAILSAGGGNSWSWTPATGLSCINCEFPVASPASTTIYTVTASSWGCSASTTDTVRVTPSAKASYAYAILAAGIPQVISFHNNSINAINYSWSFGDGAVSMQEDPSHIYQNEGMYPVVLIAYGERGCNDTIHANVQIKDSIGVIIPNVFTPNGDDINDIFSLNVHGFASKQLTIYDRWGIKVFESETKNSWDGFTTAGLPCNEGTYYYIFSGTDTNGDLKKYKGYLTLVR